MNDILNSKSKSALIIIDVQRGFVNDEMKSAIENIKTLGNKFSVESKCVQSFFSNHPGSIFDKRLGWLGMCEKSEQENAVPGIGFSIGVPKCSYSAYSEWLGEQLADVEDVYLCGMDTDACVMATAYGFFDAGFHVFIVEDACASSGGPGMHEAAIRIMHRSFGEENVISTEHALELVQQCQGKVPIEKTTNASN